MLSLASFPAFAQDNVPPPPTGTEAAPESKGADVDILPAKSVSDDSLYVNEEDITHPPLKLTPDKSELIRLDREAGTVVIGNPQHLSVVADSAQTLVMVPKAVGATYLVVLDRKGEVLMQRHVIVASPKEKYVRIRRACAKSAEENCRPTQVYYCPDMCHEIAGHKGGENEEASGGGSIEEKIKDVAADINQAADEGAEEADAPTE